jgi:hypothetical protein
MKSKKINKKKLVIELFIFSAIAVIIALPSFLPWLLRQPVPWVNPDPYYDYKSLIRAVETRKDPTSRDQNLEQRIEKAITSKTTGPVHDFFYNQAKAIYYQSIGDHQTAAAAAKTALPFAPDPIYTIEILDLLIENYTALDRPEQIKKYQDLRDAHTAS